MTVEEFAATVSANAPPVVGPLLRALWHDARGEWDDAHRIAQDVDDKEGAWVHAYLHRKEGDRPVASGFRRTGDRPRSRSSAPTVL